MIVDWSRDHPVAAALAALAAAVALQQLVRAAAVACRARRFRRGWRGRHVVVTGGSKGLGLALAELLAARGARLTVVARDVGALREAKRRVDAASPDAEECCALSADVTDHDALRGALARAEERQGPVFCVVPCAGASLPGYWGAQPLDEHRRAMEIDYFSVLATLRCVTPGMMQRGEGHVVVVSSGLALTAFAGYSSYCPPKAAVAALGHVLRQELRPYGVRVYQAFPPAMDTPGLAEENRRKPAETHAIEAGEPVHSPESCARAIVSGVEAGEYFMSCGDLGIGLLARAASGMYPRNNAVADALLLPLLVLVGSVYSWAWDREVGAARWAPGREDRLRAFLATSNEELAAGAAPAV